MNLDWMLEMNIFIDRFLYMNSPTNEKHILFWALSIWGLEKNLVIHTS